MIDFAVIGGGMAGASAAARLSELGSVTLLEAEHALGHHASGRSAAMFEESYGKPATIALNRASRADHEAMGVLSPRGFLLVGSDDDPLYDRDREDMNLDEIGVEAARRMVPILDPNTVRRAAHHADALDIDTDLLLQTFARVARTNGARIVTGARVTGIRRVSRGWDIDAGEALPARNVVNAAGAWADGIAELAGVAPLGLRPHRRSIARIAAPGGHDVSGWPLIFGAGEDWYAKPDAGALLVSPAEEDPMEPFDAWPDDMVLAEGLEKYQKFVTEPVTRPIASWAGLRTFAPDRNLVIGRDPAEPTFLWCAGQGGYGIQSSPAYGRLLAEIVAGRTPEIGAESAAALDPGRFR